MTRPRTSALALLTVASLLVAACGGNTSSPSLSPGTSSGPSASASPDAPSADLIYDAIEAQVLEIRDLKPVDVDRQTIDREALAGYNEEHFDLNNPADYIAAKDRLLKALGLLPQDGSLRQLYLDLVNSQVAGFYDTDADKLFVVSRTESINGLDKLTFAHEYQHALQDANFDIFDGQKGLLDQTDRALARAAIYEGDATVLSGVWAAPNLTADELAEVIKLAGDPETTAMLNRAPAILREPLVFVYSSGQAVVLPKQSQGGWDAVDALYEDMPLSTEQILHPDKYDSREDPIAVELPKVAAELGAGWNEAIQDTFGEFQTRTWLREAGVRGADATEAAAGWGGDRLAVLNGPDDAWAVVMKTEWDTPADAGEFEAAAGTAVDAAGGSAAVLPGEGGTVRWFVVGSDDATLSTVAGALGLAG